MVRPCSRELWAIAHGCMGDTARCEAPLHRVAGEALVCEAARGSRDKKTQKAEGRKEGDAAEKEAQVGRDTEPERERQTYRETREREKREKRERKARISM